MSESKQLVWVITGTSSGIGRSLTLAALKRGDRVIATARKSSVAQLADLKAQGADVLELDVTDSFENIKAIAQKAVAIHGRVDVVVNNAGYAIIGAIEEHTPEESLQQFNTNLFGALNVARAFLPYLRERKTGTIIFIGSITAWSPSPSFGLYAATKYAIRGVSEALNGEIAPFGLRSINVELGYFKTEVLKKRIAYVNRVPDYKEAISQVDAFLEAYVDQPGDPAKAADVIVDVVRGEGAAGALPFQPTIGLGSDIHADAVKNIETTTKRLAEWEAVARSTDF
ncbi:putative oxidoreductase YusZ [Grifola frondosa]|uniref:Putative oxidoreductase YusZ n=1 Tax=Grifola frondosa TaxID=5627 RepID=A0A1C7LMY1_GRIFR|nr:putative oxidoreductase YusZ [Grifola frondosa]